MISNRDIFLEEAEIESYNQDSIFALSKIWK